MFTFMKLKTSNIWYFDLEDFIKFNKIVICHSLFAVHKPMSEIL